MEHTLLVANDITRGLVHSADPAEIDDLEVYLNERLRPIGDATASKA
jgi:hypothetical protein